MAVILYIEFFWVMKPYTVTGGYLQFSNKAFILLYSTDYM